MPAKVIAFEGFSGVGKTTQARMLGDYLNRHLRVQVIHPWNVPAWTQLHELCFVRQEEFAFNRRCLETLRSVFFQHVWHQGVHSHLPEHDVVVVDNPCVVDNGLDIGCGAYDYMIVLTCDGRLLPSRIRGRGAESYDIPDGTFVTKAFRDVQEKWLTGYRDDDAVLVLDITALDMYEVHAQVIRQIRLWLSLTED